MAKLLSGSGSTIIKSMNIILWIMRIIILTFLSPPQIQIV